MAPARREPGARRRRLGYPEGSVFYRATEAAGLGNDRRMTAALLARLPGHAQVRFGFPQLKQLSLQKGRENQRCLFWTVALEYRFGLPPNTMFQRA